VKRTVLCAFLFLAAASSARAQSSVYVGGSLFADLRRASGSTGTLVLDGDTAGGGVRLGGFLAPRWSLELGVDVGGTTTGDLSNGDGITTQFINGVAYPSLLISSDQHFSSRVAATSVLVGYHPPARGRLRPGFRGGMSFMHTHSTVTVSTRYTLSGSTILPPSGVIGTTVLLPTPRPTTLNSVANEMAATVAAELAFAFFEHAAVVPEVRAHGFASRFVIRPGVSLRWAW
jgi:hypothetical protein